MQAVAAEFNLSETAFLLRDDGGRRPAVPAPMVHPRRRGRSLRSRAAGLGALPLHLRPRGAQHGRRVRDQIRGVHRQEGSCGDGRLRRGEAVHRAGFPHDRFCRVPSFRAALHPRDPQRSYRCQRSQIRGRGSHCGAFLSKRGCRYPSQYQ
ncbi:hypothetical protein C2845_PM08G08770 [Panicum miliaceum]|uniref:Uncharacterized protein n=1 Tax=Panicum miliaceum TaxID=4540 RepID=A0A3L6R1U5_PANMI|nr:hypothetical protein C2845_PM08G08770 [Panicum miliaceum]